MSPEWIMLGLTILSMLIGGVWWMSALYHKVKHIADTIDTFKTKVDKVETDVDELRLWITGELEGHNERLEAIEAGEE